jgi:membrane protein
MGSDAAKTIQTMIANAVGSKSSTIATIIGIATLLFGATGVFYQLQKSLNEVWQVKEDPKAGVKKILINRATGFGLILVIGFLLLISLVISTGLAALSSWIKNYLPDSLNVVFIGVDFLFSLAIITILFAAMYKFLPDVKILWKSIWPASILTSFLFVLGKYGLSIYFSKSNPASTYGATGSIILILLWISYSCLILFFGAEFIRIYAMKRGQPVEPDKYAVRVETVKDTNEKLKKK